MQYGPVPVAIAPDEGKGSVIKLVVRVADNATVDIVRYVRLRPARHPRISTGFWPRCRGALGSEA
jgi:hypothetical protein